jgi:uncharacterized protein YaeQ
MIKGSQLDLKAQIVTVWRPAVQSQCSQVNAIDVRTVSDDQVIIAVLHLQWNQ